MNANQVPEGKILVTAMLNGDGISTILDAGKELTDGLPWEDENGFAVVVPSIKELTNIERRWDWQVKRVSSQQDNAIARRILGEGGKPAIDVSMLEDVLNRFNTVCSLAARLCHELEDHPDRAAKEFNAEELLHHSVSDCSTEIRQELQDLVAALNATGAQDSNTDAEDQKIVVVIEGGLVREVLSAQGGFSVAVIDYDKNADLDDMIVIPQGDGEKNAYALAAIHEPEVTPAARVDELYSAVVEAKPAAEDEDSPRPRL